ncbi:MAG: helix-turn-helix domain-containing protein [Saprospiraceae bacterium]|nr:helix-turn-helix domain-containing protein [Saprospiraceae bacterium]MBK8852385.1 helix-turn-helix domain-containing protein [Saprospiraceae bacterium]
MKNIAIYVPVNGVIEAISPAYRLFKTANDFLAMQGQPPAFQVFYTGLHKKIMANDGEYQINIHYTLEQAPKIDLLILPAIYGDIDTALENNQKAYPWINDVYREGSEIASLCIGAFLLGESGLANGRACSTHWAFYDSFRERYPEAEVVEGDIITENGRIYSSGGANSLWNLLLYLLEKYAGRDIAIQAAKFFAIDLDRKSQSPFTIFTGQKRHNDQDILMIQQYIENNYALKTTIDELAGMTSTSRRSLERRFKNATNNTVVAYLQRVRIEAAKRSLELSRKNVNEVMYEVGYSDVKAFRDVFKKVTGLTPIEYRSKYASRN